MRFAHATRSRLARRQIPLLVLAVCLTATALVGFVMQRVVDARERVHFDDEVRSVANRIEIQMKTYATVVRNAAAFVGAGGRPESLREYARNLDVPSTYPAATGLGYARRTEDSYVVAVFEPSPGESAAVLVGDAVPDDGRREAMARSCDDGAPVLSRRVLLMGRPGFILSMPVYGTPEPPETISQRRASLQGFVFLPFRAAELFRSMLDDLGAPPVVAFRVQDGEGGDELWSSHEAATFASPRFRTTWMLRVAGHRWTIAFASLPALDAAGSGQPLVLIFLLGGVAVAVLLAGVSSAQVRARSLAEAMTAERSLLLEREREARAEAQTLHQLGRRLSAELDLDKLVQGIVEAGTELVGAMYGALRYRDGRRTEIAIAGLPRELTVTLPRPRSSPLLAPGLRSGERVLRADDIRTEPRFTAALPPGHPEVRSFLAAAVISRSGESLGGLFFGHPEPGRFHDRHERLVTGLAAQAAIAIDNAQLYRQSQEALRTRDEFFSVASHELKTPLTSLRLQIEGTLHQLTKHEPPQVDRVSARLDGALRQIVRISGLIDRMLDISRISDGRSQIELEQVDMVELLHEVVQRFEHEAERCGSRITVTTTGPVVGTWDRLRVDQVVTNLISNALKYGRGRPVEMEVGSDGESARLVIRDHGIGIASDDQARLFGQFERMVSSRNFSGFGLGLWISRQIVEEMGGTIAVASELGAGSTFAVNLPLRRLGARKPDPAPVRQASG